MAYSYKQTWGNGQPTNQDVGSVLELDIDLEPVNKMKRRRKKYTLHDDMQILRGIVLTNQYPFVSGTMIWQSLEDCNVTGHSFSWQSMKSRYQKYILPDIHNYDIPKSWKYLLTGDRALLEKDFPVLSSPKYQTEASSCNVEDNAVKISPKKLPEPDCSAINSSTITPSPSKAPLTNLISKEQKDGCSTDEFDRPSNLIKKTTKLNSPTDKLILKRKSKSLSSIERTSKRQDKRCSLRYFLEASDVSDLSSTDENEESTMNELKVVGEFHDKYDLNKDQTISLLWYFSGNVKNAMQWIEFGSELSNLRPWCKGDDSLLTSRTETDLRYLEVKYTAEKIAERNLFFEDIKL